MKIRKYEHSDFDSLVALWTACGLTRPWNNPAADIAFCLSSKETALLIGCDDKGKLIASVMVGHDGHRGWLYYLAVDHASRGRGLAKQITAHAENWLKERGAPKVMLMVRESNRVAVGFYERLGYAPEPRVVMSRWLKPPPVKPED